MKKPIKPKKPSKPEKPSKNTPKPERFKTCCADVFERFNTPDCYNSSKTYYIEENFWIVDDNDVDNVYNFLKRNLKKELFEEADNEAKAEGWAKEDWIFDFFWDFFSQFNESVDTEVLKKMEEDLGAEIALSFEYSHSKDMVECSASWKEEIPEKEYQKLLDKHNARFDEYKEKLKQYEKDLAKYEEAMVKYEEEKIEYEIQQLKEKKEKLKSK